MEPESEVVTVEPEEILVLQEEQLGQMLVVSLLITEPEELELAMDGAVMLKII